MCTYPLPQLQKTCGVWWRHKWPRVGPLEEQQALFTTGLSQALIPSSCRFWELNSGCEACGAASTFPCWAVSEPSCWSKDSFSKPTVLDRALLLGWKHCHSQFMQGRFYFTLLVSLSLRKESQGRNLRWHWSRGHRECRSLAVHSLLSLLCYLTQPRTTCWDSTSHSSSP